MNRKSLMENLAVLGSAYDWSIDKDFGLALQGLKISKDQDLPSFVSCVFTDIRLPLLLAEAMILWAERTEDLTLGLDLDTIEDEINEAFGNPYYSYSIRATAKLRQQWLNEAIEDEREYLRHELDEVASDNASYQDEVFDLKSQVEHLQDEIYNLRDSITEYEEKVDAQQEEIESLKARILELEDQEGR